MTDLIKNIDDEYWTQISHLVEENNIDLNLYQEILVRLVCSDIPIK